MTETELADVKQTIDTACTKIERHAIEAIEESAKFGRKWGRIEGFVFGLALGVAITSALAILHAHS